MIVCGINPVREALRAGRVDLVRASEQGSSRVRELVREAEAEGVTVHWVSAAELDQESVGTVHQGIVARVCPSVKYSVADLVREASTPPLFLVLDGIEDPQNVGAVLRTAEASGVDGVVRQQRRAAPLGAAVAKTSAGALAHVKIASVVNITRALDELRAAGIWTVGLVQVASSKYDEVDFSLPTALVLGSEGRGLRRLVRERCDWLVSIPMNGQIDSLNVSVAAGVALYEAVRQRRSKRSKDEL